MAKQRIDLQSTIKAAWDFLWADNLKRRKDGSDFRGDTYYLTATDVERQVRAFVLDDLNGRPRGSSGRAMDTQGVRISTGGQRNLLGEVRRWLQYNDSLEQDTLGRGHISGARYRPVGSPQAPAEINRVAMKARVKPVHMRGPSGGLLCQRPRRGWARVRNRLHTSSTYKLCGVTCPRCKNIMAKLGELPLTVRLALAVLDFEEGAAAPFTDALIEKGDLTAAMACEKGEVRSTAKLIYQEFTTSRVEHV